MSFGTFRTILMKNVLAEKGVLATSQIRVVIRVSKRTTRIEEELPI